MTDTTKPCARCNTEKPLTAFAGRQNTCIQCREAQRAKAQERKEAVAYSPELASKITDMVALRTPVAKICEMAGMPTQRQLMRWRREHEEFRQAWDLAREQRADARSDRIDEALDDLRQGKITAADCRVIVETELKLAAKEAPARYGDVTKLQAEVSGPNGAPLQMAVVDDASLIKTARWVADLLAKANAVPVIDVRPETPAAEAA
jgi:hypothetical protein